MHGSNALATFQFWYEMMSQEKHTNNQIYQFADKKKPSCKPPLVYRMEAMTHYNVEIVKLNPYLIQNHIQGSFSKCIKFHVWRQERTKDVNITDKAILTHQCMRITTDVFTVSFFRKPCFMKSSRTSERSFCLTGVYPSSRLALSIQKQLFTHILRT